MLPPIHRAQGLGPLPPSTKLNSSTLPHHTDMLRCVCGQGSTELPQHAHRLQGASDIHNVLDTAATPFATVHRPGAASHQVLGSKTAICPSSLLLC